MSYLDERMVEQKTTKDGLVIDNQNVFSHYDDLTNKQFGYVVALRKLPPRKFYDHAIWLCKCICGNEIEVLAQRFKKNKI